MLGSNSIDEMIAEDDTFPKRQISCPTIATRVLSMKPSEMVEFKKPTVGETEGARVIPNQVQEKDCRPSTKKMETLTENNPKAVANESSEAGTTQEYLDDRGKEEPRSTMDEETLLLMISESAKWKIQSDEGSNGFGGRMVRFVPT